MVFTAGSTIRRRGKIVGRAKMTAGSDDLEAKLAAIQAAGAEASRQAKARDVAIKSTRQSFRNKKAKKDA